ncbi:MAG: phosphatase PAP2 family protein [Clostridia bacterium]|nr:phosphatase PAP2 family protein [Clostridia bacterium]
MTEFELRILDFIADKFSSPFLDKVMPIITIFGDHGIFWMTLTLVLLLFRKTRPLGLSMAISLALGYICGNLIVKNIVARTRPYEYRSEINLLVSRLSDYSFPSGHSLASFEAATCIFIRYKKWGVAALIFATLISLSRLYLYVHFPSDVLAGMALGIVFGITGSMIANRIYRNKTIVMRKSLID